MHDIQIIPVASEIEKYDLRDTVSVIIDVLRASTTIVTLLEMGISHIFPVITTGEALMLKEEKPNALLIGERHGLKPEGFDFGNSPVVLREQSADIFKGRDAIFTTTNGTKALIMAGKAENIFIASMRNLRSVAFQLEKISLPVKIICAGTDGEFSIEDYYCAGKLASSLSEIFRPLDDITWLAIKISSQPLKDIVNGETCRHISKLRKLGFEKDVTYSLQMNKSNILPVFDKKQNRIFSLRKQ